MIPLEPRNMECNDPRGVIMFGMYESDGVLKVRWERLRNG